jgi:outer membrane protein TolC
VAELTVRNARREILFATAQLYYGAEALREALGVQQRQLETLRQHENDAKVRYEVGTVPRVSYLRAQIETARAEQDFRRTQNAYLSAKSALAALLNREPDFDVARPQPAEAPKGDMRKLVDEAPARRLDVEAAKRSVELARMGRLQVWAKYLPNLAAFAQLNNSNVTGFSGERTFWVAGAALSWTFLDGGLREAELAESSHKIAEAMAAARATNNKVKDEVRRAFYDLESAEANRTKAGEQVRLARENAQLVEASYDAGAATYLDVVDAQTALLGAELSSVSEGLNAELSALKLARAAGLFDPQSQQATQTK